MLLAPHPQCHVVLECQSGSIRAHHLITPERTGNEGHPLGPRPDIATAVEPQESTIRIRHGDQVTTVHDSGHQHLLHQRQDRRHPMRRPTLSQVGPLQVDERVRPVRINPIAPTPRPRLRHEGTTAGKGRTCSHGTSVTKVTQT